MKKKAKKRAVGRKYQKKYPSPVEAILGRRKTEKDKFPQTREMEALLRAAKKESERDYMLLFCAVNLGLRALEAVSLSRRNFKKMEDTGFVYIRTAKVRSEKSPWDPVPVDEETQAELRAYIDKIPVNRTHLFPGQRGRKFITQRTANNIFNHYARQARLSKKLTFHSLRHYFGSMMYEYTGDIRFVQAVMRHRSPLSSWIYVHVMEEKLLDVVREKKKKFG